MCIHNIYIYIYIAYIPCATLACHLCLPGHRFQGGFFQGGSWGRLFEEKNIQWQGSTFFDHPQTKKKEKTRWPEPCEAPWFFESTWWDPRSSSRSGSPWRRSWTPSPSPPASSSSGTSGPLAATVCEPGGRKSPKLRDKFPQNEKMEKTSKRKNGKDRKMTTIFKKRWEPCAKRHPRQKSEAGKW